jgi:GxxExxY protein
VIGSAIRIHKQLDPGLLESVYEVCLVYELRQQRFQIEEQKPLPVVYHGQNLDCGYRLDLLVNDLVIVEAGCWNPSARS